LVKFGISFDVVLFTKVVRILQIYFKNKESETHLLEILLGSLCNIETNPGVVYEFWDLMKLFDFSKRFQFYSSVKNLKIYKNTQLKIAHCLKRLAKENTKFKAREIAKISHSNPLSVCEKVLYYAESFDNQIPVLVDALRYSTNLFHDTMTYCMLNKLSREKNRLKEDGVSISSWLSNLTFFTGIYLKKYFGGDISPFIVFVKKRLMNGSWQDLIILKEIIKQMCSIEIIEEIQMSQLEAQSGGDTLKTCGGTFGEFTGKSNKKSTKKLRESLDEENILFFISKFDDSLLNLHDEEELSNSLIRLVSDSQDKSHEVLLMLLRFYEEQVARASQTNPFTFKIPNLNDLLTKYQISIPNSFALLRTINKEECEKLDLKEMETFKDLWKYFTPEFFKFFWIYSSYDIFIPHNRYLEEVGTYQKLVDSTPLNEKERKESKKKKELFELTIKELNKERSDQVKNGTKVLLEFKEKKNNFFTKEFETWKFLQFCIFPRCTFSGIDSFFCSKFVELLILYEVENFNFTEFFQLVISNAPALIFTCTSNEVYRFSFFLKFILNSLNELCEDKKIFEKRKNIFKNQLSNHQEYKTYFERIHHQFLNGILKLLK
jgi:THO complex subunit 2